MIASTSHPLYDKTNYTAPINYIISSYIREYDISKANINILLSKGAISKDEYDYIFNLNRMERQVYVGNLQRDNQGLSKVLKQGIQEVRNIFLTSNNINESDVLAIRNDAVFIINKIPTMTQFGNIEFVCKGIYTSFYKLCNGRIEIYYSYDMVSNTENITVKGIKEDNVDLHKNYFLEILMTLFHSAQTDPIEETLQLLMNIYDDYISLNLDIGYYRTFNSESRFQLKKFGIYGNYTANFLSNDDKSSVEVSYNLNILRELGGIYSSIQNKR